MYELDSGEDTFNIWEKVQMMLGIEGRSGFVPTTKPAIEKVQDVQKLPTGFMCNAPYVLENGMCVHRISPTAMPLAPAPVMPKSVPTCNRGVYNKERNKCIGTETVNRRVGLINVPTIKTFVEDPIMR